ALIGLGAYGAAWQATAAYHLRAARRAAERRDFAGAGHHLAFCLRTWPEDADTHFLAARVARRAGAYAAAEKHLDLCRRVGRGPGRPTPERALLRAQCGELPAVERFLQASVDAGHPEADLILEALAQVYQQQGRVGLTLTCLNRWLERQPDHVPARLSRAAVWEQLRRFG